MAEHVIGCACAFITFITEDYNRVGRPAGPFAPIAAFQLLTELYLFYCNTCTTGGAI